MKRFLIVLSLALAISGAALSQETEKGKQSTVVLQKMRQIDLLNHILPVAFKKEQLKAILPEIERARRDVKIQEDEEAKFLSQKAAIVDQAVKDGIDKGDVPDKQLLKDLNAMIQVFYMKREAIASDNTTKVLAVVQANLNAGQMKVMANSLNVKIYFPNAKPEEVKDEDKVKMFVREILLDPLAYDLLVKIQAGARG